ncbi:MAG: hypothetical protein ACLU9S_05630 [Oscillospiraceae bacterium]
MAGLGAGDHGGILRGGPWLRSGGYRLVLQCQSSQNESWAVSVGGRLTITREEPVRDGKFLYTVLEAKPGSQSLTPGQHFASPALLSGGSPLVGEYLAFCRQAVEKVVLGLEGLGDPNMNTTARL